jgi:spore coat protein U-like protein
MFRSIILCLIFIFLIHDSAEAQCSVTASGVNFGTYSMFDSSDKDSTGTVTVSCTVLLALFMTINTELSVGNSGSYSTRQLRSGAQSLNYNLYTDTARQVIWGNGSGGTSRQTHSALLSIGTTVIPYTVYGRIPRFQSSPSGTYTDSIVVSVIF